MSARSTALLITLLAALAGFVLGAASEAHWPLYVGAIATALLLVWRLYEVRKPRRHHKHDVD